MTGIRLFFIASLLLPYLSLHAQTRMHAHNNNAWLMYFGNHKFADKMGLHAEVQLRRSDYFSENQQLLLRAGLDFYAQPDFRFTIGYGFVETYPYGEFAVQLAFPEHRIWQQLLTHQDLGKIKLAHRYRLEQRMIGNSSTGKFANGRYENRMRYMAKATLNITDGRYPLFAAFYDEIFINFGSDVGYNIFDQNRMYGALGCSISPNLKMELGYLYQVVQLRNLDGNSLRKKIENNHTLQIALFSTIPLSGRE